MSGIDWERVYIELAELIAEAKRDNTTLVQYNSATGEAWRVNPDGTVQPYEMHDESDWEYVKSLTDEEVEALAASDNDSLPMDWLDKAVIVKRPS